MGAGFRRFKFPVAGDLPTTVDRIRAAREAAPDAWLDCEAAWVYRRAEDAQPLADACVELGLDWLEDVFPPGDLASLVASRDRARVPIAMGDEQGGAYNPQARIDSRAVGVIRIDLTCMGGISGGRRVVDACMEAGVPFAPHMFAPVHSQVFSAWGHADVPVEWGAPWIGVDPYADSLQQPRLLGDGRMAPLEAPSGFGALVNPQWISTQVVADPAGLLDEA